MEETNSKKVEIRKGIMRPVTKVIPEQVITEEVEVDTLKEFLTSLDVTEEQARIAIKSYKDEKVTQPSFNMNDVLRKVEAGKKTAERLVNSSEKQIKVFDSFTADALIASKKWLCVGKTGNPKQFIMEKV